MPLHFTVLASGSAGNASLLEVEAFGLLLDVGLGPRNLAKRLVAAGASWNRVHAALLTHTHSDHWRDATLRHLLRRGIPLYCHAEHHESLLGYGRGFAKLRDAKLVHNYEDGEELGIAPGLRCRPFAVPHDGGATFGFRFETSHDLFSGCSALAYAADFGSWTFDIAEHMADVDLLALEFNHDVDMEYASGRSPYLIARVLGDDGHLSNDQAGTLLQEVVRRSAPGRLQHVVQLHLSRDCNRPSLAAETVRTTLADIPSAPRVYTASQDEPTPTIIIGASGVRRASARKIGSVPTPKRVAVDIQPSFPCMEA
jgi:phosphoribosyl 1,2-cyclic phosphodiesterase